MVDEKSKGIIVKEFFGKGTELAKELKIIQSC